MPHIDENVTTNDDILYENMVDELYNPTNYEFMDGGFDQTDCINSLTTNSYIAIPYVEATKTEYTKNCETGLFNLFFTDALRGSIIEWTNHHHARSGAQTRCKEELDTFLGLVMAMFIKKGVALALLQRSLFLRFCFIYV